MTAGAESVESYIAAFPENVQVVLRELRQIIRGVIPEAEEAISYAIPTFRQHGRHVVYFGGFTKHVSLYPAPVENAELKEELAPYASGKGTVKFPLSEPLPAAVIRRIVELNAQANEDRTRPRKTP